MQRRAILWLLLIVVCSINLLVFVATRLPAPSGTMEVSFLDVGQGDAILITGPTGIQLLVDGGRDRSAVRELPKVMNLLDRRIEMVLATHPDADHIGGLPDVLSRYRVSYVLTPGREGESEVFSSFEESIKNESGAKELVARAGMRINLGGGSYADVLYPGDNVAHLREPNDASVILRVVYGDTEFLLTGDAPSWVEERLVSQYGASLQSDVLKAGHHGSRSSTSKLWLAIVQPEVVVVSAGENNSYGHPHPEVLENVEKSGATLLSTVSEGTITYVSDGITYERKRLTGVGWWR
ncbi:MBL fold metallo-hydrolase [Patescibacteria group bacterium]|nr:MBL fold metallo-hydrolase [Patescibacteria group bacterium]